MRIEGLTETADAVTPTYREPCADVAELLPELTLAQHWDLTVEEPVRNVHTHPTLSEALQGNVSRPARKDDQLLDHSWPILTASARRAAQMRT